MDNAKLTLRDESKSTATGKAVLMSKPLTKLIRSETMNDENEKRRGAGVYPSPELLAEIERILEAGEEGLEAEEEEPETIEEIAGEMAHGDGDCY